MRRQLIIVPVLGVFLLVLTAGPPAFAGGSTHYAGKNSQGLKLRFTVEHTANGPKFVPTLISQITRCPVTGEKIGIAESFGGFQVPIKHGKFNFVLNSIDNRVDWSGKVTSTKASGKESIELPGFDKEGGLQSCGAGSLSWTAKALASGSPAPAAPSATYVIKVTKTADGSVHYSITH